MEKFLFLPKKEYANTWINGGKIPLRFASNFKSKERKKNKTPDEVRTVKFDGQCPNFDRALKFENCNNILIENGVSITNEGVSHFNYSEILSDGLVFCCSNNFNAKIALKFGSEACVKINDILYLLKIFNAQIGKDGIFGECKYTQSRNRNTFLKGDEDKWQDEFRLFWDYTKPKDLDEIWIEIPKDISIEIPLWETKRIGLGCIVRNLYN